MPLEQTPAADSLEQKNRTRYVQDLSLRYLNEMRLLFRGGKLTKKDKWRNVAEHCVVQLATAEVLADLLGLSPRDRQKLCSVAAVHDWRKRIEKKKIQDPDSADTYALRFLPAVDPDPELMEATGPKFIERVLRGDMLSFLQKLQCYLDDICGEREEENTLVTDIMPLGDRIAEVSGRNPHPENEEEYASLKALLAEKGKDYWTVELDFTKEVELEIWKRLGGEARGIARPEDVPIFLRSELQRRMGSSAALRKPSSR